MPKFKVKWKRYITVHYCDILDVASADEAAKIVTEKTFPASKGLTFIEDEAILVTGVEPHEDKATA